MASRRKLKKKINCDFENLAIEMLTIEYLYSSISLEKTDTILLQITDSNYEFTCRAHHAPSKYNVKEIQKYYSILKQKLDAELAKLSEEIKQLLEAAKKSI